MVKKRNFKKKATSLAKAYKKNAQRKLAKAAHKRWKRFINHYPFPKNSPELDAKENAVVALVKRNKARKNLALKAEALSLWARQASRRMKTHNPMAKPIRTKYKYLGFKNATSYAASVAATAAKSAARRAAISAAKYAARKGYEYYMSK